MNLPPPDRWDTMKCEPAWSRVAVEKILTEERARLRAIVVDENRGMFDDYSARAEMGILKRFDEVPA